MYCHSRKDGCVYLVINNSRTDATTVELPKKAVQYTLAGRDLVPGECDERPCLCDEEVGAGVVELAPCTCTFFVL